MISRNVWRSLDLVDGILTAVQVQTVAQVEVCVIILLIDEGGENFINLYYIYIVHNSLHMQGTIRVV